MAKNKEKIKQQMRERITSLFLQSPAALRNYKQVAKELGEDGHAHRKYLSGLLYALAKEGFLLEAYKGKFKLNPLEAEKLKKIGPFVTGRVDMKQTGKAYIISDELLEDVRIQTNNTGYALHDDLVKVRLFPRRKSHKTEGEIIEILERAKNTLVGTLQISHKYAYLIPDSKNMPVDLFIPLDELGGAKDGEKAIAEITEWMPPAKNPHGRIVRVLGEPGNNEVEMHAILAEHGLPHAFPGEIEKAAASLDLSITEKEIRKRLDVRSIPTFTIDPEDAKDFDDALSVRPLNDGLMEIGVHIADVTHYVQPNSIINEEAYQRATSIYLVDRTIPMLPETLSNFACSLRPDEDKLCYSVVFQMNQRARVLKTWVGRSVIRSDKRFTYEEVQDIIEGGQGPFAGEIGILNQLAMQLRQKRMGEGAIDFDRKEVKFRLDDQGKPLEVLFRESKEAHKLVEEFMLLANRSVAEKIGRTRGGKKSKIFVYRIHDIPNVDKLNSLSGFVSKLGYQIRTDTRKHIADSLNKMLQKSQGKGEENMIETLTLRSMAKAVYSTNNIGHYGLAFDHYTHFTSPIRRYPDMMVHRLLQDYEQGKSPAAQGALEAACKHASDMEKKAQQAEWDSIKYKQVEFMADKIGEVFDGLISGVSKWGIYVEIKENKCEGMVRLKELDDDYYYLDEDNYQVIGHNKRKRYKLGDPVQVRILRADFLKKELDLSLA